MGSMIASLPSVRTMLPLSITGMEPEEIVNSILPLYFNGQILKCMQESVASELAARMTAMQAASDNASALKKSLTIRMNRARQAKITQELMEIVAGAEAV